MATPTRAAAAPAPAPDPPVIPTTWTPATIIVYVASMALFIVGLLTLAGVTIPASVAKDVQLVAGLAVTAAGPIGALVVFLSKQSVAKKAILAGVPPHVAMKL